MTVLPDGPVTAALLTMLRTATGKQVGDGEAPMPVDETPTYPYAVLDFLGRTNADGPISSPHADVDLTYQVTAVGKRRDQVDWMADAVRTAILGRNSTGYTNALAGTGWRVILREPNMDAGSIEGGQLKSRPERYTLRISPA